MSRKRFPNRSYVLLAWTVLVGASGCGRTGTISGKVTYQGRPVTYGSVIFLSSDNTAKSGVIQPDGSYAVEGVRPGEVRIGVISRDPAKGRTGKRRDRKVTSQSKSTALEEPKTTNWFPLPHQFEDPGNSGISITVGSGRVSHDIELK